MYDIDQEAKRCADELAKGESILWEQAAAETIARYMREAYERGREVGVSPGW